MNHRGLSRYLETSNNIKINNSEILSFYNLPSNGNVIEIN